MFEGPLMPLLRRLRDFVREANKPLREPKHHDHLPCFEFLPSKEFLKWYGLVEGDKYVVVYGKDIHDAVKHCQKAHPKLRVLAVYCDSVAEGGLPPQADGPDAALEGTV